MTPQDKAKELVESMAFSCRECDYEEKAKQCALIAVDEMINVCYWNTTKEFLLEVKKEIEAL